MKTQPIPVSNAHTTHTGLEMMPRYVVSLGKFPCFIFYCLTSKRYSTERFLSLLASARFLHCHTFAFTMWNFTAALQLFVFSVQMTIGLNCAHTFAQFYSKMQVTLVHLLFYGTNKWVSALTIGTKNVMSCSVFFFFSSKWQFGNAGLGLDQHDSVGSVW